MNSKIKNSIQTPKLRDTTIRRQMLSYLSTQKNPVSVKEILSEVRANKTTIYREIFSLQENGHVNEVDLGDSVKRYELTERGHHHHLVCVNCKSVTEFNLLDDFKKEEKLIKSKENFVVLKHNLEFFGYCLNCQ